MYELYQPSWVRVFQLNILFIIEKKNQLQRWELLFKLHISVLFPSAWVLYPDVWFIQKQISNRTRKLLFNVRVVSLKTRSSNDIQSTKCWSYYKRTLHPQPHTKILKYFFCMQCVQTDMTIYVKRMVKSKEKYCNFK